MRFYCAILLHDQKQCSIGYSSLLPTNAKRYWVYADLAFHNLSSKEIFILDTQSSLAGSTVVADIGVDTDPDEGMEVDVTGTEEAASTGGSSELADTGVDTDTGEGKEVTDAGTEEASSTSVGSNEVELEATSADDNNELIREAASATCGVNIGRCNTSSTISLAVSLAYAVFAAGRYEVEREATYVDGAPLAPSYQSNSL
ncbi:hypothetical protein TSUD_411940 [Trifolium subterraneum]|uniref:Uncharacterized protein n=1 Tax=Trifolium subterraneum TaxID=3900 RepID=A0A2Z6PVF8_TRISU|nr:hypothetical protein TSUD_411940 [Trifolium subterraneum]